MFGWINKKIGTSGQGGSGGGDGGGGAASASSGGSGNAQQLNDQVRDLPASDKHGRQSRRGSFLDAVGGAMAIGRSGGRGKKDDKSEAAAIADQLDAQRAERISCVAFKLVREIQRILKEAREKQAAAAAAAAATAALSSSTSSTAVSSPHSSTAGAGPTPSPSASRKGVGSPTVEAAAAAAAAAKRKNRWAGTEELLSLLDGGSPGGAGEVEDKVERYGSIAEVQAKMSDLVEQALVPESHGDLCGQLLEAATGDGHHPGFVKLCVDAGLPSNLVHCLRIMRVVEFESAMYDSSSASSDATTAAAAAVEKKEGEGVSGATVTGGVGNDEAQAPLLDDDRPKTERATERIGQLLVTLCRDKSAGVGEQIKPHLPGLLSLAVSAYPRNGAHVQETAGAVVEALMSGCLNSSMVWLLHYNKAMLDVVGELRHLSGLDGAVVKSPPTSRKANRGGYIARSVSPKGSRERSPKPTKGEEGRPTSAENVDSETPSTELVGAAAEERGLWLAALRAAVSTVRCASRFVPAFVQDFESAGGYETVGFMVRRSSIDRLPAMLEQVCLLVSAMSTGGMDQSAAGGGGVRMERSELMASNPTAFNIIRSLLAECTPPVEAVCLQGVAGRVSAGTCELSCLSGGHGLADNGLDPEDAVVMVAERAVAMRLDRWGREHGVFPEEAGGAPLILSIASSSGTEDDEDDDSGVGSCLFEEEGEGDSSGTEARTGKRSRRRSRSKSMRDDKSFARVSVGAGEMAASVSETDEFRLRLLEAVLGLYSNHPLNYHELETKFHVLSFFLCALPYYENRELKGLALKTLEVICVSFKDVHPRDALHSTSTAFTVCLDHMMGLLSDPLCTLGSGCEVPLVGADSSGGGGADGGAAAGAGVSEHVSFGGEDGGSGSGGADQQDQEEDPKDTAALQKALILLEDADMMRQMLEKLLEFDEKKFTTMFQATGILDQVLQPLLKRVLTLNVAGCPGAAGLWRAMRRPGGLAGSTVDPSASGGERGGGGGGASGRSETGCVARVEETGALALVSRATGLLCGTLALLLGSSQAVCRQFRALRMHDTLYRIIRDFGPPGTEAALSALERACSSEPSGVPEDMAFLIELVQGSKSRAERWRQAAALMGLRSILLCKHQAVKDVWRESCGFEASIAAISSLDAAFSPTTPIATRASKAPPASQGPTNETRESTGDGVSRFPNEASLCEAEYFRVMQAALFTLVASASAGPVAVVRGERLVGYRANRRYLRKEISYDSLACCLVNSGVVASPTYAGPAVRLLFTMVTELPCDTMRLEVESGGTKGKDDSRDGGASLHCAGDVDNVGQDATVRNADAVMVILGVLPYLSEGIAWAALGALNEVVRAGGFAEAEALITAGVARKAADILAKALHAKTAEANKKLKNGSASSSIDAGGTVGNAGEKCLERKDSVDGSGRAFDALSRTDRASRRSSLDVTLRSRKHGLWEPLRLTQRIRQRLVEFIVLVASRHMTQADLAPVIRSVTLPLVMDSRGHVAPPTVWPSGLARPPLAHADGGEAFWLPGWGTFVSPPSADGAVVSTADDDAAAAAAAPWPWLDVLAAMSACAQDSTPFLRLGGSANTDMSSLCHEVSRAGWRAGAGLSSTGSVSSSAEDADGAGKLWCAQQKALVEAALEEGVRMVHVPGLEGSASAASGDGGGGSATPDGSSWPGPSGYSFACWMRFNPPGATSGASEGQTLPTDMKAWNEDAGRAAAMGAAAAAAATVGDTSMGRKSVGISEGNSIETSGEERGGVSLDVRTASTSSTDKGSPDVGVAAAVPTRDGSSHVDTQSSVSSTSGRRRDLDDDRPRPHLPGRQVLWMFAVASPDGRAFVQLFLDLDLLLFCLRGSSIRGEVRFKTPRHLACGGSRVWHHALLAHSRSKSRILGTKDKLCLWVDGELADTVKVESTSFTTSEGPPCAYLGCPHPQAFLDVSLGATVAPVWHLGPCALITEAVELAPLMFAVGPEYTGVWTAESPLEAISSANAAGALRRLQALSGAAGFEAIGGDVPHALQRRGLRALDRCFDVTDRAYYWQRSDRAGVTDSFYLLLAPELVTFAYNTRHMERPGGPTPPDAAGGGGGVHVFPLSDDPLQGGRGGGGGGVDDDGNDYDAADGSRRPSQVPASAKRAATLSSLVSGWLFNAARETAAPSAGPGPVGCAYGDGMAVTPSSLPRELSGMGGPSVLFPLLQRAQTEPALCWTLRLINRAVRGGGASSVGYMQVGGGYSILAGLLRSRRALLGRDTVRACFEMAVDRAYDGSGDARAEGDEGGLESGGAGGGGGDAGDNAGNRGQDVPWGGPSRGLGNAPKAGEGKRQVSAWGWEEDIAFMPRDEVNVLFRRVGVDGENEEQEQKVGVGGREHQETRRRLCPFVLLTDPYALKLVVMNHQVWGLKDRGLMMIMLQMVHSLVSPHNSKPYCRFNARVLHRIGIFRSCLHFLLEASEPPRTAVPRSLSTAAGADPADGGAAVGKTCDTNGDDNEMGSTFGHPAAVAASSASAPIAGFGGVRRPTAAVAAAGLDTRDGFMVSCTLLLQRVLAICAIQRDFDRVVGATLSTLADGEATGSRESRRAGVEPTFAPAEAVLRRMCLLGEEESGRGCSIGDKVLSGQALVRLYLMRMLLEVVTLPVAAASRGELNSAEGVYVGGVGSPCARQAQRAAEDAAATALGAKSGGGEGGDTQLERWIDGVPPVVDVVAADGSGLPSPLYVGRQRLFKSVCSKALRPDWFISMLETCQEEAGVAWTFRLLAAMLQSSEEFRSAFQKGEGFRAMAVCLPRYAASLPVLLSALALALGVPIAALPATGEGMDAISILSLLRRNAGTAPGPARTGGDSEPTPFVRVCVARVILPCLRVNAALLRRAEAAGVIPTATVAATAATSSSPSRVGAPPSPSRDSRDRSSPGGASGGSSLYGSPKSGFGEAAAVTEASDWRRTLRVNEIMSAAMWEALMNDPSFRLACRSPEVVGALVNVLGGTWDEPEQHLFGANNESEGRGRGGAGEGETGVGSDGSGDGSGRSSTSGGSSSVEGFPPQANPHPPAELLRIVIADIVANGGSVVFPSLVRVFSCGAAVMGPMLRGPSPVPTTEAASAFEVASSSSRRPRDLSPLGREAGSASAGIFQRAMVRHLETCSRDAIALAAATVSPTSRPNRSGKNSPRPRAAALSRALGSVAAVSAAVAEAAAEGLLPGVETGHLAVGLVLSLLRQITAALGAVSGAAAGVKGTALGACHIATVVALRRTIQREAGKGGYSGGGGGGGGVSPEGNLLEESLLMIAHNFDALLGEERKRSTGGSDSSSAILAGTSATSSPPFPPPTPITKSPVRPKPPSPNSSASTTPRDGRVGGKGVMVPPPLDLSSMDQDPSVDAPLTAAGVFADTPAQQKWASRFEFPDGSAPTSAASMAAAAMEEANRLAMTFSALELPSIGSSSTSSIGSGGGGPKFLPLAPGSSRIGSPNSGRNRLWESAAKGAAGLVAAADRGVGGVGGGGGRDTREDAGGVADSLVYRMRGTSSDRAFVAGFVAELRALLLSDSQSVRNLATRLTGALLARRRAAMQELLGEELLSTGFSMLEHTLGGEVDGGGASFAPATDEEAVAEGTRSEAFALWLTGGGQEASVKEALERATERSYTLVPHVSSAEGLTAALSRAEFAANGGGGGGGGPESSALSKLGSGFGALTSGPNRRTITVDRAIQRADMIARTYERVAASHGRWVWAGADDLAWGSKAWRVQLSVLRGKVSLWEGGLFGRLMLSPEAVAVLRPGSERVRQGVDAERYKLDMDEGPERTRLHLRPNRDFYDMYEVLAPAPSSSSSSAAAASVAQAPSAAVAAAAADTRAAQKASSPSRLSSSPLSATASPTTAQASAAARPGAAAAAAASVVAAGDAGSAVEAAAGGAMVPAEEAAEANAAAATVTAVTTVAAVMATAMDTATANSDDSVPTALRTTSNSSGGGNAAEAQGEGEGLQVAAIAALVKTMSASVGVGGKGGARQKQPLKSVFDLDDTDCSALLELEELQMESSTPDGGDDESFLRLGDSTGTDLPSPVSGIGTALPAVGAKKTERTPQDTPISTPQSAAAEEELGCREDGSGELGGSPAAARGSELQKRGRERDPGRAFSLGDESDAMDGDTIHGSEMSTLDDDNTVHDSDTSALDSEDKNGVSGVDGGGSSGGGGLSRGRSLRTPAESAAGSDAATEGSGSRASEAGKKQGSSGGSGSAGITNGEAPKVAATPTGATAPSSRRTSFTSPASLGPGASAREEGWSDRDLLIGLMQPEDTPVVAAHDVSRSFGGVVVKRGLLLVCRSAIYFVDGFGTEPALPRPDAGPPTPAAAAVAAAAASRSKDPLHGVRRLEEWELGGGAGGTGGANDDGDVCGAKIRVMLRRHSQQDSSACAGAGPPKGGGTTLTAEQAAGAGFGVACSGGGAEGDDILALGRFGVQRFALDRLHAVYKRRYQLRDCGLEIFDVLGRSILVSFSTREQQEEVLTLLLVRGLPASIFSRGKHKLRLATGSSHAQARAAYKKFMQAERISWTKKWQSGRCTNFAYLMALNTLAGRSFNDLTQYPVLPWVLSDYVSQELDLDNPAVYRDLSKPMGAIGEARARQFTERYAAVIEAAEETGRDPNPPPFHYGTHYSCAGYILHYLLRLEPFTRLALALQGGRFDKADRLFRDIRSSWESASSENLQDVRELTPEFYNLPEFLVNSNGFDLGVTQKGQGVNDVVLPPWARGDPGEFIRLHRKALESPHVSKNLHSWIGLIFGCKQRGPEAVEAQNVFVHLTYEGEVDIDSIQDPLERDAALAQIHNFGQTPSLVLKKPHPQRELPPVVRVSSLDGSRTADPAAVEWHTPLTPPLCIVGAPDAVALRPVSLSSAGGAWHSPVGGGGGGGAGAGGVGDARIIRDKIAGVGVGAVMLPMSPDKYIRFGGPSRGVSFFQSAWGGTGSSSKATPDRLMSSHEAMHLSTVTVVACSEDGGLLLTGASDGTCRLWTVVSLPGRAAPGQVSRMLDLTASLGCHKGPVTCASVCMGSGSAVTGGADGTVLVWDIRRSTFVHELSGHRSGISSVDINKTNGNVVTLSGSELRVWTVNGRLLASCSVTALRRGASPTCAVSTDCPDWQDGVVAATGHDNGDVLLWSIEWGGGGLASQRAEPTRHLAAGGGAGGGIGGSIDAGGGGGTGESFDVRVLKLERVLSGAHQNRITFIRVCEGGREMLVGDSLGEISRWQCIRLDQLSSEELNQLV